MLEMAKMNDLNIDRYLKVLLKYWSTTDEQLAELAPWSEKLWSIKKSHVNYSELLQLENGWSNFIFYRFPID